MDFMTVQELAETLHVTKAAVYRWTHEKRIPYIKLGKQCLFRRDEIAAWLEAKHVAENPTRATQTASKGLSA